LLGRTRAFFAKRGVLEVETPLLGQHTVTEPNIASLSVSGDGLGSRDSLLGYLQTSPEYAMKRLLRGAERGRMHNPEFSILEWYRPGYDHHDLMSEVADYVAVAIGPEYLDENPLFLDYADVFAELLGIDIDIVPNDTLRARCGEFGMAAGKLGRDAMLEFLLDRALDDHLDNISARLVFVYDFPVSQGALARRSDLNPQRAERFELYIDGIEVANGYHELNDSDEQRDRFERDNERRAASGDAPMALDQRLIAALQAGLPDCAGVAIGLDRLLMLDLDVTDISDVLTFPFEKA
jgi:lysyl-tRNA synthetase class 2